MALTTNEIQVTWSASDSVSVSAGGNQTSDAMSATANTPFQAVIICKADNASGSPSSGDTVEFYLLGTIGDPDGSGADEYTTPEHGLHLCTLDTEAEDPVVSQPIPIPYPLTGLKVYAVSNAGSNSITVSAIVLEQKG